MGVFRPPIFDVSKEQVVQPDLVRRACGGWLATAPKSAFFRIGVTGDTEDETLEKFRSTYVHWLALLAGDASPLR